MILALNCEVCGYTETFQINGPDRRLFTNNDSHITRYRCYNHRKKIFMDKELDNQIIKYT
jgi:hypothetical protein